MSSNQDRQGTPPANRAGVPFITADQRQELRRQNFSDDEIDAMKPDEAHRLLGVEASPEPTAAPVAKPEKAIKPLDKSERGRLYHLGYKAQDILELGALECRRCIRGKVKKEQVKASGFDHAAAATVHTDERIDDRAKKGPRPSGIVTQLDEYTQQVIKGDDPIDAKLNELAERFPGTRFRAINPDLPPVAGAQFQTVYDDNGFPLKVGDLVIGQMPEDKYDEQYRQPNLKRSQQMSGQVQKARHSDGAGLSQEALDQLAPQEGRGLGIRQQRADMSQV